MTSKPPAEQTGAPAPSVPTPAELREFLSNAHNTIAALRAELGARLAHAEATIETLRTTIESQRQAADEAALQFQQLLAERDALIASRPARPMRIQVCTLIQPLGVPEVNQRHEAELAERLSSGWTILHIAAINHADSITRIVTLQRPEIIPHMTGAQPAVTAVPRTVAPTRVLHAGDEDPSFLSSAEETVHILRLKLPVEERAQMLNASAWRRARQRVQAAFTSSSERSLNDGQSH